MSEVTGCLQAGVETAASHQANVEDCPAELKEELSASTSGKQVEKIPATGVKIDLSGNEDKIKFVCDICKKEFNARSSLHLHKKSHVDASNRFKCPMCDRCFKNKGACHTHIKSHTHNVQTGETRTAVKCSDWRENTSTSEDPQESMEVKTEIANVKRFTCDVCERGFWSRGGLLLHKQIHEGEKNPFKCSICGSILNNKGALQSHVKSHSRKAALTEEDSQEDEYSLEKNNDELSSKRMEKEEWCHKCSICNQFFRLRGYFLKHMKRYHSGDKRRKLQRCIEPPKNSAREDKVKDTIEKIPPPEKKDFKIPTFLFAKSKEEESFVCEICSKVFARRKGLKRHMEIHTRDKYKCRVCDQRFSKQDSLIQHKRTYHDEDDVNDEDGGKGAYKCTLCNKNFKIKICFEKHLKNHTGEKAVKYECKTCGKWFDESIYLRRHMIVHSEERPYKCNVCGQSFKYNVSYCRHMMSHPGGTQKSHVCPVCNKSYAKPYLLKSHMIVHSNNRPFKCQTCNKGFHTKFSLRSHVRSHTGEKPFKCEECGLAFRYRLYAERHRLMHTGITPHKCSVCEKAFAMKFELSRHMKHCTREKFAAKQRLAERSPLFASEMVGGGEKLKTKKSFCADAPLDLNGKSVVCTVCNKVLPSRKSLAGHMNVHPNHPEKKYKCDFCNKAFSKIYVLKLHLKVIHKQILVNTKKGLEGEVIRLNISNRMLFKCPVCGLVFIHHKELATHMRIHTGQKPYECSCGEMFNGRTHLQHHVNTCHPERRPKSYPCSVCGKRFRAVSECQRHMLVHTGKKPYKCVHCGVGFMRKGNVKEHIKRKHPLKEISIVES